jgi:hypothetical protein
VEQPRGELVIQPVGRLPRRIAEQSGIGRDTRFHSPHRDPDPVAPPARSGGLDQVGEPAAMLAGTQGRKRGTQRLAVQRMDERDELAPPVRKRGEQALGLECRDHVGVEQTFQDRRADRLGEGHELGRRPHPGSQPAETRGDRRGQVRGFEDRLK